MTGDEHLQRLKSPGRPFSAQVAGALAAALLMAPQLQQKRRERERAGRKDREKGHALGFKATFRDYLTCRQGENWAA